jgi:predicted DNA-binding protein with PD1-like motif
MRKFVKEEYTDMYTSKAVSGGKYVLSIDNREEIAAALAAFCEEKSIKSGSVIGLGAVNEATLRIYDPTTKRYADRTFHEQMELANLTGNISRKDGRTYLHLHATFGRADYSALAGHLLSARISGACELVVADFGCDAIGRRLDETGLNLYEFK